MFSSLGLLIVTGVVLVSLMIMVVKNLHHKAIDSKADSFGSILGPIFLISTVMFSGGFMLALNPMISLKVTHWLAELGVLNGDFTAELPKVDPIGDTDWTWRKGETEITFHNLTPGGNYQYNYMLSGQEAQKVPADGKVQVPKGTTSVIVWRQQIRPGIASEVTVITPK